jgi:hypothetical protein
MSETLGELDIAQLRDGFRDSVRQSEQRSSNGLESAEASFHRTLAEWVAFTLGSMFGAECDESVAGQLGHVRCSLITDGLQSFTTGDGRGPYGDDVLGAFVIIDDNRVEEVLIATTDVLGSDEFERHAENRQVGGVCTELRVGDDEVEAKTWTSLSAATSPATLGGGGQHGVVTGTGLWSWRSGREPGTQRASGQGQRFAEPVLSEARYLGTEAEPGSDEQGPQRWTAQVDLSEHGGGHGEQGSEQRYLVVLGRLSSGAPATTAPLERCLPGGLDARAQTADALGVEALDPGRLGHPDGEPVRANAVNQGHSDDDGQGAWRSGASVQENEWG